MNTPILSQINLTEKQIKHFWTKIDKKSDTECWLWLGSVDKDGYGRMSIYQSKYKKMYRANRLAFFLSYPNITDQSLLVRHTCNNPKCCNPKHLILGSSSDNAKDIFLANRGGNKLNFDIVKELRQQYLNGITKAPILQKWVEKVYNIVVSVNAINVILRNDSFYDSNWQIVDRMKDRQYHAENSPTSKLNWSIVNLVRELYNQKVKNIDIQKIILDRYKIYINKAYISSLSKNKSWYDKNYVYNTKYKTKVK